MKLNFSARAPLPQHLKQRKFKFDMVKHYGDYTNPVEHWHLFRWGADQTVKAKGIVSKNAKKRSRKTFNSIQFEDENESIIFQNHDGHWIRVDPQN
jgi:hypothetical protein